MRRKGDRRGYDGTFGEVRSEMFAELVKMGACDLIGLLGRGEEVSAGLVRLGAIA
jgi:hypothetical protein